MYTKAEIIYGKVVDLALLKRIRHEVPRDQLPDVFLATQFPVGEDLSKVTMKDVFEAFLESDDLFEMRYSGGADETPRFLGVSLCKFDETAHVKITDLQLSPTAEQYMEARTRLEKFPAALRPYFEPLETWIFWSTS
jgi:hypothetical protein